MNSVQLIGRLTKDPECRYTADNTAVVNMTIAIDRPTRNKATDFPQVIAFGKTAENCEKHLKKGLLVGVEGRIQTGNYINKNGEKVYTTDVVADRVEFLEWADKEDKKEEPQYKGFRPLDEDEQF